MALRPWLLGTVAGLLAIASGRAEPPVIHISARPFAPAPPPAPAPFLPAIPLDSLAPPVRARVAAVLEQPTLGSRGPAETFNTDPATYHWLIDHPDQAAKLWRQLGAKVAPFEANAGVYRWHDAQGSDVRWHMAFRSASMAMWYVEGKVKPAAVVPLTSFRAIAVMHITEGKDTTGKPAIRHQVHFFVRCDSKAAAVAAKVLGASAPKMAEQYLGQLQLFYGGMAWYLSQDPDRARQLFGRAGVAVPAAPAATAETPATSN